MRRGCPADGPDGQAIDIAFVELRCVVLMPTKVERDAARRKSADQILFVGFLCGGWRSVGREMERADDQKPMT